jgi:hypothetical protein
MNLRKKSRNTGSRPNVIDTNTTSSMTADTEWLSLSGRTHTVRAEPCGAVREHNFMRMSRSWVSRYVLVLSFALVYTACAAATDSEAASAFPLPGHVQVALLPHAGGLQYCADLTARSLAPPGSINVYVHSLSAYVTTAAKGEPAYAAITGRYPGWDTPRTTIYNQPFTNTNTVWLEIIHEFPLGIACIEVYGHELRPSTYASFKDRILVSYTYQHGSSRRNTVKFFPVSWGRYLPQFSPRHRPKH